MAAGGVKQIAIQSDNHGCCRTCQRPAQSTGRETTCADPDLTISHQLDDGFEACIG